MNDERLDVTLQDKLKELLEKDKKIVDGIVWKYQTTLDEMLAIVTVLMSMGYGRNKETANLLKAVAEAIESPMTTLETLNATKENKLQ